MRFKKVYSRMEQTRKSTDKISNKHLREFKTSKSTLTMEQIASDRSLDKLGSAKLIRNCTTKVVGASISRLAIFIDISLQIKDISVK